MLHPYNRFGTNHLFTFDQILMKSIETNQQTDADMVWNYLFDPLAKMPGRWKTPAAKQNVSSQSDNMCHISH